MNHRRPSNKSRPVRCWARVLTLALLGISTACAGGEETGDTDSGGGSSTDPNIDPGLPGVRLECCYTLGVSTPGSGPEYDQGCIASESAQPCVDPTKWGNQDDEIDAEEAVGICALKCPTLPGDYPFYGAGFVDENGAALEIVPPFDVCTVAWGEVNTTALSCDPTSPGHTAPWSEEVPPTHEGSFTSQGADSSADITVNGITSAVEFSGKALVGISDCEQRSRQEVCVLDLQSLAFDLESNPVFGDYQVDTAQLQLNMPARTTVSFVCDGSGCSGSFDFLARTGTSIAADFAWDQTNLVSGGVGGGSLALGKDRLGNISRVTGELDLDAAKSSGTIRLWGAGEDGLGGEVASVTFDLSGPVAPYTP